jgi:hypothetical protein
MLDGPTTSNRPTPDRTRRPARCVAPDDGGTRQNRRRDRGQRQATRRCRPEHASRHECRGGSDRSSWTPVSRGTHKLAVQRSHEARWRHRRRVHRHMSRSKSTPRVRDLPESTSAAGSPPSPGSPRFASGLESLPRIQAPAGLKRVGWLPHGGSRGVVRDQTLRCSRTMSSLSSAIVPAAAQRPFSRIRNSLPTRRAKGSFCSTSSTVTPVS